MNTKVETAKQILIDAEVAWNAEMEKLDRDDRYGSGYESAMVPNCAPECAIMDALARASQKTALDNISNLKIDLVKYGVSDSEFFIVATDDKGEQKVYTVTVSER